MSTSIAPSQFWRWIFFGVVPLFLAFSSGLAITAYEEVHGPATSLNPNESVIRQSLSTLMSISPLPERAAPNFTLTDQMGKSVRLSQFHGKSVVLTFMDSRCTEVCPLIAQEFISAEKDLGRRARSMVFVGVNVNPHANSVADVRHFTSIHGLSSLNNWYFLTGPLARLVPVWRSYGIEVILPKNGTQTVHSSYMYFLNPLGRERFLADASVAQRRNGVGYLPPKLLQRWGRGIAYYLEQSTNG
ncbi:MAG: SCO family protein [Acidobacteria bacterium]|nr:SCO family protein [Acidobacteriota bacterium]